MNTFTVSFFGHRDFSEHLLLENHLETMLKRIISEHEYIEFLVGRNGEFDRFVSSIIRRIKRDFCESNNELVLVLPYSTSEFENNMQEFRKYYDRIEIFEPVNHTHFKVQIRSRNHSMVMRSNLVICYVNKKTGGAYNAVHFAGKNSVPVINISEFNV